MATEDVVKSVARKLKYYFEIKRLEDGFDLSHVHKLTLNHPPQKTRPAHQNDGLHDKALKQYFSEPNVKSMLTQLNSYDARGALQGWREIEVRKMLDNYMKHYTFQKKVLPSCYYYHSHKNKSQAAGTMLHRRKQKQKSHTRRISTQCTNSVTLARILMNVLHNWPVKRTIPDQHITKGEAERLVNSATKIICGSELSSLGMTSQTQKQGGKRSASTLSQELSSLGKISHTRKRGGKRSASTLSQIELSRPTTARSGSTLENRDQQEKKGRKSRSSRTKNRQTYKQTHSRSTSPAQSTRTSSTSSRTSSSYSHSSRSSVSSSRSYSHSHTPRQSPRKNKSPVVVSMPGQKQQAEVGVERSTQTEEGADLNKKTAEHKAKNSDDLQDDDDNRPACEYQVHVCTGNRLGSGTAAPVKLTLFGDKGRTEEFDLGKMSKRHKIPFQKGNEDLFLLPAHHVGRLTKIQIGHDRAQINYAWYLENVTVYDMHAKRVFQFPCGHWLSGQDGDKKTYRILQADSEREFTEATDASMAKSAHKQRNDPGPGMSSAPAHKSKVSDDTSPHSKPQGDNQNSSIIMSSNVRLESNTARFQEGETTQRGKKDDYEQKATKIILRSVPGSKIVDEIILENDNTDTNAKPGNDVMESYKSPTSEPGQKKQLKKEIEKKPQKDTNIHAAVRNGDLDGVKDLLQQFPELKDRRDENGWTPLHMVASSGNMEILRWLITSGADVEKETPKGFSAMHVAAMNGHVNIMVILQARGASISSCTKEKQSALHLAAKSGHLECVKWLVANRATLDAEDTSGQTPFRLAEKHHNDSCADFLRVCMQELGNPKSSFAQIHARQVSGADLPSIREQTVSGSSKSNDHDDDSNHDEGKLLSDIDNESRSEKYSKLQKKTLKKETSASDSDNESRSEEDSDLQKKNDGKGKSVSDSDNESRSGKDSD